MRRREFVLGLPVTAAATRVGSPAPPFEFASTNTTRESLAKYRGKTVALYFFNPG